jgi:hypothetical protein
MWWAFLPAVTTGNLPTGGGGERRRDLAVVLAVHRSRAERRLLEVEC